jgi:hypothetical protein
MDYLWVNFPLYPVRIAKFRIKKSNQWIHLRDFVRIMEENYIGDKDRNCKKQFQLWFQVTLERMISLGMQCNCWDEWIAAKDCLFHSPNRLDQLKYNKKD